METVIRITVIYVVVMASLRLMGKREFSQLSPFELVTLLLIPEIASQSLIREDFSLTNAVVGLFTLFLLVFATSLITHMSPRAAKLISSSPSVLVSHGRFHVENLNGERVTPEEVFAEMHRSGIARIEDVEWAVLESDGKISIVSRQPGRTGKRDDEAMA